MVSISNLIKLSLHSNLIQGFVAAPVRYILISVSFHSDKKWIDLCSCHGKLQWSNPDLTIQSNTIKFFSFFFYILLVLMKLYDFYFNEIVFRRSCRDWLDYHRSLMNRERSNHVEADIHLQGNQQFELWKPTFLFASMLAHLHSSKE